jgi:hypothetical protein
MVTIDKYIKEAFITKKNIGDARKANNGKFVFVPVRHSLKIDTDCIKEFSSYDELMDFFRNEGSELMPSCVKRDPDFFTVVGVGTAKTNNRDIAEYIKNDHKHDWQTYYRLNMYIKPRTSTHINTQIVGYVNCSKEEME